ncbi:MAG: hypothetical protein KDD25_10495, partial [Bdellovibrionales bacterium]|nr:hypothetical protein [Bdellovibrionales bacterium]
KAFFQWKLGLIDQIFCVSENDRLAFLKVSDTPTKPTGDPRYEQVMERLKESRFKLDLNTPEPIFLFGSTWREDEAQLIPEFSNWIAKGVRLILVPHEPKAETIAQIEEDLKNLKVESVRWSQMEGQIQLWNANSVLIVDRVGILAELYKVATFAFIGGSFRKSVHSVMESLGCGNQVFVGPEIQNNREAIEFSKMPLEKNLSTDSIVTIVESGDHLSEKIANRIKWTPEQRLKIRDHILSEMQGRLGASDRILNELKNNEKTRMLFNG